MKRQRKVGMNEENNVKKNISCTKPVVINADFIAAGLQFLLMALMVAATPEA